MKKLVLIPTTLVVGLAPAISFVGCGDKPQPGPTPPTGDYLSIKSDKESTISVYVDNAGEEFATRTPNLSCWDGYKWNDCDFIDKGGHEYSCELQANADNDYTIYLKGENPKGFSLESETSNDDSIVSIQCFDPENDLDYAQWTIGGSVMALIDGGDVDENTVVPAYCFENLFQNNLNVVHVSNDFLPANNLEKYCYSQMFNFCLNLQDVPYLPAMVVPDFGYYRMFWGCNSLQNGPSELKATTVGNLAYESMFAHCRNLTAPATIKAETMGNLACYCMYDDCGKLEMPDNYVLPNKPSDSCYGYMFADCASLTKTCELPVDNLATKCYEYMFSNCPNLQTIKPITVAQEDITSVSEAFEGMFEITERIKEKPVYRFNETTGDNAVIDLTSCTNTGDNFANMFKGRLGDIQQPVPGKKYAFENHEQQYDIIIVPHDDITVTPTKFELGQDLVITYSTTPYFTIDPESSKIQVGDTQYLVSSLEYTETTVTLPGQFVTDKNITVDFYSEIDPDLNFVSLDQYSTDFWGDKGNLRSEEREIKPDTTYYYYVDLSQWDEEVGTFFSMMIGTKDSDAGKVKIKDFVVNSDLGELYWAVLSEDFGYMHTNINIEFNYIIQYLFGWPSYLYGTITTDHWEGENPKLRFFFY